jgi:ABC-type transport system substrate-binding protein
VLGDDGFRHKGSQTLELNYSTARLPSHLLRASVGPFAQAAWAQIGVKLDVHIYPADFFGPGGPADDAWEIAEYATGTGYDPDDRYSFMCDLSGMHYCNPTVDQAEMTQESTTDQATRLAAFKTIHRAILDDLPVMYLYSEASVGLYRSTLHNYQPFDTGGDTWNCWEWYLDQG